MLEGYTQQCQEWYGHPATQHSLNKIQLLYEERIHRRCAEYNLTMATPDKFLYVLPAMKRTEKINCEGNNFSKAGMDPFLL